jgi:V8-like Glu-specific endopeptidase
VNSDLYELKRIFEMSVSSDSLPIGENFGVDEFYDFTACKIIKNLINRYVDPKNAHVRRSLGEKCALKILMCNTNLDCLTREDLAFVRLLRYHNYPLANDIRDWHSLFVLYETWKPDAEYYDHWIKFHSNEKFRVVENDQSLFQKHTESQQFRDSPGYAPTFDYSFFLFEKELSMPYGIACPSAEPSYEIGRVVRFTNGCVIKHYRKKDVYTADVDRSFLLMLAGDVETNPGPVRTRTPEEEIEYQHEQIVDLMKMLRVCKKKEKKYNNKVQRAIELEKRTRNQKRKQEALEKRCAQGVGDIAHKLVEDASNMFTEKTAVEAVKAGAYMAANAVCPGVGTTAALVVNGAKASSALNQVEPTLTMLQRLLESLTKSSEEIRSLFSIPVDCDFIAIIVSLISIATAILQQQLFIATIHCLNLARQLNITMDSLMSLVPNFSLGGVAFGETEEGRVGQSLVTDMFDTVLDSPHMLPFTGFLSFLCGVFSLLCVGTIPTPTEMTRHFANVGRAAQGFRSVKDLFDWLRSFLEEIYYTTVYGLSAEDYKFIQEYPDIENLYAASQIITSLDKQIIKDSRQVANQILTVNDRLQECYTKAIRTASRPNITFIGSIQKSIADQVHEATVSPARKVATRQSPLSLFFYGQAGVGKSVATEVIKARIFKHFLKDKGTDYGNCAFTRNAKTKYWEGYTGQPIVLLDDFANAVDSQVAPVEEFHEIIGMVNTAQYPLNMAALQSKGQDFFTSQFVLASSNLQYPIVRSLVDPSAIYRRFNMYVECSIDPSYGVVSGTAKDGSPIYKFDKRTIAEKKGCTVKELDALFTEHYRFDIYTVAYNQATGSTSVSPVPKKKGLDFEDLWKYILEIQEIHDEGEKRMDEAIRKQAGLAVETEKESVSEVMVKFDRIFCPEKFVAACASGMDDLAAKPDPDDYKEACGLFGAGFAQMSATVKELKDKFAEKKKECSDHIAAAFAKLKANVSSPFSSIASFILSFLETAAGTIKSYLPSAVRPAIVSVLLATATHFASRWLSQYVDGFFNRASTWCSFNQGPSDQISPCQSCKGCTILQYPRSGNMIRYFLQRTAHEDVRKILLRYMSSDHLAKLQRDADHCMSEDLHAQRVYENQPRMPPARVIAQRVYETQPHGVTSGRLAQNCGVITCKTDMEIGAQRYAQRDQVQVDQTTHVLLRNSVWIQAADEDGICSRSNGVFLVGRTMMTTAHTILSPPRDKPVKYLIIRNPYATDNSIRVPITECSISKLKRLDGSPVDLCLVTFPPCVPNRPRILSKFVDAEDVDRLPEGELIFAGFYEHEGKTIVQQKYAHKFQVNTKTVNYHLHAGVCPVSGGACECLLEIGTHVEYDLETKNGMCGALLTIANRLVHSKLIGIHVAGGKNVLALGALTTRQFLESSLAEHTATHGIPASYIIDGRLPYSQSFVDTTVVPSLVHAGDCLAVGVAKAPLAPVATQLNPSAIFDKIQPHITRPAHLTPTYINGERVDPMAKGIAKVLNPQTWVDSTLLEIAAADVFDAIGRKDEPRVFTHDEAIVGDPEDPYIRPINRTTSPGYPYNLDNPSKGKTHWLGHDETYITDNAELRKDTDDLIDDARNGIRGNAISLATLKDEKRPHAKVDACKTRVFEACPQHLVIAIRRYFLDFSAHVMKGRISNGIAVGVNPISLEWTRIAEHLLRKGNNMVAGDFSNFDGSLLLQILVKICDKINEWYGDSDENQLIRSTLWEHICNADVLVRGEVIRQTHSQPSGNPLTVIINSIFNAIVMRMAYLTLKQRNGLPLYCDYRDNVAEIIYGDDDVKSISRRIVGWFNQQTITAALASMGLTYTDETKSGTALPFKALEDVTFLKRRFVQQPDATWACPMDIENILEITNWIRGKATRAATVENCTMALSELAQHPRNVYENYGGRIREELRKVGITLRVPTYVEQQSLLAHSLRELALVDYAPQW